MLYSDEIKNSLHLCATDDKPIKGDAAGSGNGVTDAEEEPSTGEALAARGGSLPSASCDSDAAGPASGPSNTQYMTYKPPEGKTVRVSIDYFKARFIFPYSMRDKEIKKAWTKILEAFYLSPDMECELSHGGSHYEKGYQFGENFFVFSGGGQTKVGGCETSLIEMKGDTCRSFLLRAANHERFFKGNKDADADDPEFARKVWSNAFKTIAEFDGKVTRFDVPVDDFSGIVPLNELKLKCLRREYVSRMRKPSIEREVGVGDEGEEFAKEVKSGKGWSFTLGKRTSPQQLCIYDKKAEIEAGGNGVVFAPSWVRFESRFYGDRADELFPKLAEAYASDDPLAHQRFIVGCLAALIEFKDKRLSSDNTYKSVAWAPWILLIACGEMPQFAKVVTNVLSLKESALWLAKATDRSLVTVLIAYVEELPDVIRYLIIDGLPKFDKVNLEVANEQRMAIGKKPFKDVAEAQTALFEKAEAGTIPSDDVIALFDKMRKVEIKPIAQNEKKGD